MTQLRHEIPKIRELGAELFIIGNGTVQHLNWYIEDQHPEAPAFTDPTLQVYDLAGFRRDLGATLSPKVLKRAFQAYRAGFRQTTVKGESSQQGGVLVVKPNGELVWKYASQFAGDHPDPATIVERARQAVR